MRFAKPLQPSYDAPFKVLSRSHFKIDLGTRTDSISIDGFKFQLSNALTSIQLLLHP